MAAVSSMRGVVEVLTENSDGSWRLVGSFFAGGTALDVVAGRVGGVGVVAVRDGNGSVALLGKDPMFDHRLGDARQAYRRFRNGQAIDQTPPATAMALADLDRDGSDELIVAAPGLGVAVVGGLSTILAANPEKVPAGNGFAYDTGPQPSAVAAVDLDGDGLLDLVVLDAQDPTLRLYKNHGKLDQLNDISTVKLPASGSALAVTGCPGQPLAVLLSDGHLVVVTKDGKVQAAASDLVPVQQVAGGHASLALTSGATQSLALYDACATVDVFAHVPAPIAHLAIGGAAAHDELAVLSGDGKTVSLFSVGY